MTEKDRAREWEMIRERERDGGVLENQPEEEREGERDIERLWAEPLGS